MKSNLFICTTPYDIFNSVNLKISVYHDYKSDIIIMNNFENSFKYIDLLEKANIFNEVIFIKRTYKENFKKKITLNRIINRFIEIFNCYEFYGLFSIKCYDKICCSYNERICRIIYQRLAKKKKIEIDLFEDGLSTYLELPFIRNNKIHRILKKKEYNLKSLYVYDKKLLCWENSSIDISNIPTLNESKQHYISSIFNINSNINNFKEIIYLDQPVEELNIDISRKDIADFIIRYFEANDITLKLHPRKQNFLYDKYNFQIINNNILPWEVMSMQLANKIIITFHSTAALTPIFLYNKNNKIIFLYKLFSKTLLDKKVEEFLVKVENEYPNKVFIPKNENELEEIINNIRVCFK